MRMNVASWSVFDIELRSPICSSRLSYSLSLSRCFSSSFSCFFFSRCCFFCSLSAGSSFDASASLSSPTSEVNVSGVNSTASVSVALSCAMTRQSVGAEHVFYPEALLVLLDGLPHTKVYLLALDSIFVPSIYSTSSVIKPRSANSSTTCVKMLLISFFTRLRKRLIVTKSGRSCAASHI